MPKKQPFRHVGGHSRSSSSTSWQQTRILLQRYSTARAIDKVLKVQQRRRWLGNFSLAVGFLLLLDGRGLLFLSLHCTLDLVGVSHSHTLARIGLVVLCILWNRAGDKRTVPLSKSAAGEQLTWAYLLSRIDGREHCNKNACLSSD